MPMVKKIFFFFLCFVFCSGIAPAAEMYTLETIERVLSGDTFRLESGKKVRLIGADAPENEANRKAREDAKRTGQSVQDIVRKGKAATDWVARRLTGKKIFLKYDQEKEDGRGREWVYAFLYDESLFPDKIAERKLFEDVQFEWWQLPERAEYVFLNATIIRAGYAVFVRNPPNVKYADRFEEAYWQAKEDVDGLWNVDYFSVPCKEEGEAIGEYIGQIVRCCGDAMPIFDQTVDGKCQDMPIPGAGGFCSNCGNNICETEHLEDSCNCPEDCK